MRFKWAIILCFSSKNEEPSEKRKVKNPLKTFKLCFSTTNMLYNRSSRYVCHSLSWLLGCRFFYRRIDKNINKVLLLKGWNTSIYSFDKLNFPAVMGSFSKNNIKKKRDFIGCEGPCRRSCVKLSDVEYKLLSDVFEEFEDSQNSFKVAMTNFIVWTASTFLE